MALIACDECGAEISDKAVSCPHCGIQYKSMYYGWEYKSKKTLFGLPLVHIASGMNPDTGRPNIARGIFAMGNMAVGVFAFGGMALGGVSFGGLSLGLVALGGCAVGGLAVGGCAIGLCAIGGAAVGYYAFGGGAIGAHVLCEKTQDPQAVNFFSKLLGDWVKNIGNR